jgi:hypothetical protein
MSSYGTGRYSLDTRQKVMNNSTIAATDAVLVRSRRLRVQILRTEPVCSSLKIYRCWVVYGKSWLVICPPILLWLYNMGYVIFSACAESGNCGPSNGFSSTTKVATLEAFYACTVATNLYATCMALPHNFPWCSRNIAAIVYRILRVAKASGSRSSRLYNTSRIIADSGALFAFTSLVMIIAESLYYSPNPSGAYAEIVLQPIVRPLDNSIAPRTHDRFPEHCHGWYFIQPYRDTCRTWQEQFNRSSGGFRSYKQTIGAAVVRNTVPCPHYDNSAHPNSIVRCSH